MIIKVCGMRDIENIRQVKNLDIDMMGFIFWPKSPRYVTAYGSQIGIMPDNSEERLQIKQGQKQVSRRSCQRVGVFVEDMPQDIVTCVYNYSLDYVQLHGEESPVLIENLRRTLDPDIKKGIRIIKAFNIATYDDFKKCRNYEEVADLFLFDTKTSVKGGSGEQFDWSLLEQYDGKVPFLLSGGIGPNDAERIKAFHHPKFEGIDLNSRFEVACGVKNVELLKTFIKQIRQ